MIDHSDFGPGYLPTSGSQDIKNAYIVNLWNRLSTEERAVLEETLPLTHLTCLESVLQHFQTSVGGYNSWYGMRDWIFDHLLTSLSQRLKAYLMILTTPGRVFVIPELLPLQPPNYSLGRVGVIYFGYRPNHWKFSRDLLEDFRAKKAWAHEQAAWVSLQRDIQNLPLDLNLLIRDALYGEVFGPGKDIVFPYEGRAYMEQLRALSRRLYEQYSNIYYCENMWVIGEGSAKSWIETSNLATPTILSRIRNITLKWTWMDARKYGPIRPNVQEYVDVMMATKGAEDFDNLEVMWKFEMGLHGCHERASPDLVGEVMRDRLDGPAHACHRCKRGFCSRRRVPGVGGSAPMGGVRPFTMSFGNLGA